MVSKQGIEAFLKRRDIEVTMFDEVASTNTVAAGMALEIQGIAAIVARGQTAGRGTRGRAFFCRPDQGLYLSLILRPKWNASEAGLITPAAGVAVTRAIKSAAGVDAKIKWVNDIVINDQKLCGILAESRLAPDARRLEYAVIGIGINLFVEDFPSGIAGQATSLHRHSANFDVNLLAAQIIDNLCGLIDDSEPGAWMDEYRRLSSVLGRRVIFDCAGSRNTGLAVEINHQGNLVVETEENRRYIITAGDVSIHLEDACTLFTKGRASH